ncbi:PIN domain-containing protein [[Pseudomonas] carboxydohydrogena]|uniref:PIN domain-containing protein n=1 Tax=Afipia carboxydohydrogena TaxID=290 RepID=A0ABY8BMA7_AFICR|nr:PIN domain-containing protein [[Pseudomonas] carboxydohydrogena]WEF51115.1 PIN domain-containing protein [[Pseudomonas] carboxydohydrogena]
MSAKPKRTRKKQEKWLVFVDTNIFLDFYRLGNESAKRTLATLEKHAGALILTDQVWMEFLKNRQKVITQTLKDLAKPTQQNMPSILSEAQAAKGFVRQQKSALAHHKKVVQKIEKILQHPERNDAVFQSLSRIFKAQSSFILKRPSKRRYAIRHLARKRFALGYPPRKDDTLRMGDAINWEWIIECACEAPNRENIVIVSRDGDFGLNHGQQAFLNDWLRSEFKERVSRQRKIELTTRLSTALKKLDVNVAKSDVVEENRILSLDHDPLLPSNISRLMLTDINEKWIAVLKSVLTNDLKDNKDET